MFLKKTCDNAISRRPVDAHDLTTLGDVYQREKGTFFNVSQWEVKEDDTDKFMLLAEELAIHTMKEEGCQMFQWTRVDGSTVLFNLLELWASREVWVGHRFTPHYMR